MAERQQGYESCSEIPIVSHQILNDVFLICGTIPLELWLGLTTRVDC
jgi:hypothetical protein